MRFYEYESRRIVERAGIPVTEYGFAKTGAEAEKAAKRIDGPTVIKSQVLTGGRMKAGGVKFADAPAEAKTHAEEILKLEIGGHMPVAPVLSLDQALDSSYLRTTGMIDTVPHPDRADLRVLANPIKLDGQRLPNRAGPLLGSDTDAVLAAAGYDEDEIAQFRSKRVI